MYDYAVVGGGLIGSAAAWSLCSADRRRRVCLVGPDECDPRSANGRAVFGAHYDEGRIARRSDPDPTWAWLAQRSVSRYRELERESGVRFFSEVGHLTVGVQGSQHMENVAKTAEGLPHSRLSAAELSGSFPHLSFGAGNEGVWEPEQAGHVSARAQVSALQKASGRLGAQRVVDEVTEVQRLPGSDGFRLHLRSGGAVSARHVIVAAGAFTNSSALLPGRSGNEELELQLLTAQTLRAEITAEQAASLSSMPSVIYKQPDFWCYVLPPVRYPCGRWFVKIGGSRHAGGVVDRPQVDPTTGERHTPNVPGKRILFTPAEVSEWYRCEGDRELAEGQRWMLQRLMPGLRPLSYITDTCVTTHTSTKQLVCGRLGDGLTVVTGGNGYAAKSAIEIGRMAAMAAEGGGWRHELPERRFSPAALLRPHSRRRGSKL